MFIFQGHRVRSVAVGLATVLASLISIATAHATVTQSSITTPSQGSPTWYLDEGQSQNVTIAGSSDGTTGDQVDILCYQDNGSTGTSGAYITLGVPVSADGSFTTTVPVSLMGSGVTGVCRLRAVPAGTSPSTDLSRYAGPITLQGSVATTISHSIVDDFTLYEPQLGGAGQYGSLGGCGLTASTLFGSDPGAGAGFGLFCSDGLEVPAPSDASLSGVQVDGQPAYPPAEVAANDNGANGAQGLALDWVDQDPDNGDLTAIETEPLQLCSGRSLAYVVTAQHGCDTSWVPSGVEVVRTIHQYDSGKVVQIDDSYQSTDGAGHAVELRVTQLDNGQQAEFPGQTSYSTHGAPDQIAPPSAAPTATTCRVAAPPRRSCPTRCRPARSPSSRLD